MRVEIRSKDEGNLLKIFNNVENIDEGLLNTLLIEKEDYNTLYPLLPHEYVVIHKGANI